MNHSMLVLFDLDGTLVRLNPDMDSLQSLRESTLAICRDHRVDLTTKSILGAYTQLVQALGFKHQAAAKLRQIFDEAEREWVNKQAETMPGLERLSEIKAIAAYTGLVTSNGVACVNEFRDKGILELKWFDFCITRDDSPGLKPSAEPIEMAWHLAKEPSKTRCVFVGDSDFDQGAVNAFNARGKACFEFIRVGREMSLNHALDLMLHEGNA